MFLAKTGQKGDAVNAVNMTVFSTILFASSHKQNNKCIAF